ncbi:MAG TPA: hypothetical protein PK208_11120 [Fibrobacteria bacterium]|mgnify:FL=1|nr:hypothetical protein [Fibrobacteria bacterium]
MNANVSSAAAVVATNAAKPSPQTAKTVSTPVEASKHPIPETTDNLDLSEGALALQEALAPSPKIEPPQVPIAAPRSQWDQDKLDRIDRLEVLLHQGQYKVEPFMVDEIALRLARFMVAG